MKPGDMVTRRGAAGTYMVLRVLEGGMVRIRRWPILESPPAEDVPSDELTPTPPEDHE